MGIQQARRELPLETEKFLFLKIFIVAQKRAIFRADGGNSEGVNTPMGRQIDRETVLRQLARVAFCRANDGVRLVLTEGEANEVKRLQLDGVSKVKRGKDGSVEVEFCDRVKALQLLYQLLGEEKEDRLLTFLEETK